MYTGKANMEVNNKVEQIKFGSEVSFRASSSKSFFIYCDGYIDSQLLCINMALAPEKQINFGRMS